MGRGLKLYQSRENVFRFLGFKSAHIPLIADADGWVMRWCVLFSVCGNVDHS
jgi:hypothetical protein